MDEMSADSPKSTDAEHGSSQDCDNTQTYYQNPPTPRYPMSTSSRDTTPRPSSPPPEPTLGPKGKFVEQDHPTYRFTSERDTHEEFRATSPVVSKRKSESLHRAAARKEIKKLEKQFQGKEVGKDNDSESDGGQKEERKRGKGKGKSKET